MLELIKLKYSKEGMLNMTVGLISITSILVWIAVAKELSKPSEKQNKPKIMTFTALGLASTILITVSLFQTLISG